LVAVAEARASVVLEGHRVPEGRACSDEHRRVAVLTPYSPYPLAHAGAVRIYHLVRRMAEEFDVELFAFHDKSVPPETAPVLEFCARVVLVEKPRYAGLLCRRPTSASFDRRPCAAHLASERRAFGFDLLQVECPQLAPYGGDVLVEHDVTFDLFGQIARHDGTLSSGWDYWRWLRMERRVTTRYRRVVVLWEKDAKLLARVHRRW
jgi:hypothetical protein